MNDRPTCKCGVVMTPENSAKRPELFLCDKCVAELFPGEAETPATDVNTVGAQGQEAVPTCPFCGKAPTIIEWPIEPHHVSHNRYVCQTHGCAMFNIYASYDQWSKRAAPSIGAGVSSTAAGASSKKWQEQAKLVAKEYQFFHPGIVDIGLLAPYLFTAIADSHASSTPSSPIFQIPDPKGLWTVEDTQNLIHVFDGSKRLISLEKSQQHSVSELRKVVERHNATLPVSSDTERLETSMRVIESLIYHYPITFRDPEWKQSERKQQACLLISDQLSLHTDPEKCENCGELSTGYDSEGVPLCDECKNLPLGKQEANVSKPDSGIKEAS